MIQTTVREGVRSFVRLQEEIFLELEREDCIVVHQYRNNGYNIVLDVNSGAIHVVDDVTYDVIPLFEAHTTGEIVAALKDKYKEEEIKEIFSLRSMQRIWDFRSQN